MLRVGGVGGFPVGVVGLGLVGDAVGGRGEAVGEGEAGGGEGHPFGGVVVVVGGGVVALRVVGSWILCCERGGVAIGCGEGGKRGVKKHGVGVVRSRAVRLPSLSVS